MAKITLPLSIIALAFATSAALAAPGGVSSWQYKLYKNPADAATLQWLPVPAKGLRIAREFQGFIEYRARLELQQEPKQNDDTELGIYLGRIADVDRTYVNDILIGDTGSFPPNYENNMDVVREYRIPRETLRAQAPTTLRVIAYVEYMSSKGLDLSAVEIGSHRVLQRKKYVEDLFWYGSRMFIPILCLILAAISVPWLAPSGLRLQQTVILLLGVTCFIFGICRSRSVFHFMELLSAYRLTGMSSVLAVTLICWLGILQAKVIRRRNLVVGLACISFPVIIFWPAFIGAEDVLGVAAIMKQWFTVSAVMIWAAALLVALRAGPKRTPLKIGFVFLAAVTTNDILRDLRVFKLPILMDLGFGVFLITLIVSQLVTLRMSWIALARREVQLEHDAKIGKVSGLLSHDLRNKIGSVSALIDVSTIAPELKDKIASLLGRIRESVEIHLRQAVGTQSIVSFHSEEVLTTLTTSPTCSLGGVVQTCIDDLRATHTIDVIADIPRKAYLAFVPIEYSEMSRCATNILLNAIEASTVKESNAKVYLSIHVTDNACEIVIKDQGKGFPDKALEAVLAGSRMTTKPGGTGLGVISAKSILNRIGGDLRITSSASGSVVRLMLPRVAPPSWFYNIANSSANELVVLDDDTKIHAKIKRLFPEKTVFATTLEEEFLKFTHEMPNALALVDFDFGGSKNGLELIQSMPSPRQGVLVSGRISFDGDLRTSAISRGIRMYPKECLG